MDVTPKSPQKLELFLVWDLMSILLYTSIIKETDRKLRRALDTQKEL